MGHKRKRQLENNHLFSKILTILSGETLGSRLDPSEKLTLLTCLVTSHAEAINS